MTTATATQDMSTMATNPTNPADRLETETCSRCGGSGTYSYCYQYGTRCFKCAGRKIVYTKRGLAASRYLEEIRSVRADSLKVGDVIKEDSITMGGTIYEAWFKVESIGPDDTKCSSLINGVMVPGRTDLLHFELAGKKGDGLSMYGIAPEKMIRIAQTAEQKAETMKRALAYQATLTKQGVPRKR